jgi:hypothetical protein
VKRPFWFLSAVVFLLPSFADGERCRLSTDEAAIYAVMAARHMTRYDWFHVSELIVEAKTEEPSSTYPAMGFKERPDYIRGVQASTLASYKAANRRRSSLAACRLTFPVPHAYWDDPGDPLGTKIPPLGRTRLFLTFSRVGFSKDGTQAFLYNSYGCGGLCGEGFYTILTRTADGWKVVGGSVAWIS